jgi:DNA polymerase III alpha subunit (gram-positive type)
MVGEIMNKLYMPLDNETGGLGDDVSLLSTYLEVVDEQFNVVDSLELYVKPNDGVYRVEAEGLSINKINLIEHDKIALTYSEAGQKLFKFLQKNSQDGKIKLIPLGKNVQFDIAGLQKHLLSKTNMEKFVSYREIDITGLAMGLQIVGKLPPKMSLSLTLLAEYPKVHDLVPDNTHEAKYDTQATVLVYKRLLEML